VIVYDPFLNQEAVDRLGVQAVDLTTLAREADYISLHTPLIDSTRHLVNAEFLALMKPTAYLINAARGPLIDETALLHAVRNGQIAGAALDVLAITPHSAWYSEEAKIEMRTRAAEEVVRVLQGQTPRAPANKL
jgi:D-3-phosphoglycerate dehydrogenase